MRFHPDNINVFFSSAQVFLKEQERQLLQDTLNKEVMHHIITLQRWFRACLLRFHFLQRRDARRIMEVQFLYLYNLSPLNDTCISSSACSMFQQKKKYEKMIDRGYLVFQSNWRQFYVYQNRAATVIQTAWRSSQKRLKHQCENKDNEGTSQTRLGRDR